MEIVLDGQELDLSNVLVPTGGGPSSDLSAEVARALRDTIGVDVSLMYVVDSGEEASGREFLAGWADGHGLGDAELRVEAGDVEETIGQVVRESDLVIVGRSNAGCSRGSSAAPWRSKR